VTRRVFRSASKSLLLLLVLCGAQNACKHREAPSNAQGSASALPARASSKAPKAARAPRGGAVPKPTDPGDPEMGIDDQTDAIALAYAAKVPLLDQRGAPLPQIDDCPAANSTSFQARMRLLFLAIVKDNPDLALPAYFPLVAYEQLKSVANPERDYRNRLLAAFARDIHEAHVKLGANADAAEFVAIEVPDTEADFMNPGSEGNKLGYFRVLHSRLTYRDAVSSAHSMAIASLISWRGEWYVLHLSGAERAGTSGLAE
jgi:hypothetical protein